MTDIKKVFAEKKFPSFIKDHEIFRSYKEIKKVFPEIGLPNCEKEILVDNSKEVKDAAANCLYEIESIIAKRLNSISKFGTKKQVVKPDSKRKAKLDNCIKLLTDVRSLLSKYSNRFITSTNGKITLNLPQDILDAEGKVIYKAGEGLFRIYNKLNETLRGGKFLAMSKFEDLQCFKTFSSVNIPGSKHTIKFSSDGTEGFWDIATMSMRGISSCQSWGQGNATHVVGSVVDPFTGIIYLTSGAKFNEHGSKMIRRCVVRFMVNEKTKIPFICLEKMYPAGDNSTLNEFIKFVKERTDNKFEVHYAPTTLVYNNSYVPMSKIVAKLTPYDQPYRDSGSAYKVDVNDDRGRLRKSVEDKVFIISETVAAKVLSAARVIKIGTIPESSKKAFRSFRGSNGGASYYNYSYNIEEIVRTNIKNYFINKFDKDNKITDKNLFLFDALTAFLKTDLEKSIFNLSKDFCIKTPALKTLDDTVIENISTKAKIKIEKYINDELKKIEVSKIKQLSKPKSEAISIYTKLL